AGSIFHREGAEFLKSHLAERCHAWLGAIELGRLKPDAAAQREARGEVEDIVDASRPAPALDSRPVEPDHHDDKNRRGDCEGGKDLEQHVQVLQSDRRGMDYGARRMYARTSLHPVCSAKFL